MRLAITSLVLVSGCILHTSDRDPAGGPGTPSGPGNPSGPGTPPPPPVADGAYAVRSHVEITIEALLPAPAADLVDTLRDFSQAPAHTLIELAEDAGVPAVGTLRALLPDVLESKLEGWIDAEIAKLTVGGVPVPQLAATLVAYAETALTQVGLDSTLTIDGDVATHRLTSLDLSPAGLDTQLALGDLPGEIVEETAAATTTTTATRTTLSLGDHGFSVAYGEYAWQALEAKFVADHGAGIRATLGAAVNCPLVASRVASKCVLGVCVGHAAELTSVCERGLDEVVTRAHAKLATFRFDALRFASGTATLVDDDDDRVADRMTGGVWTAEINAGMGLRHAPATFTATR